MAALLKGMMGNKWKWQWSGSGLSLLLLLQLTNASGWRWIRAWFDPRKGRRLSHPVRPSFYLSLHLSTSLTHFSPATFLILFSSCKLSFPFSFWTFFSHNNTFSPPSPFPLVFIRITIFWATPTLFLMAYYLLRPRCPLCDFTPFTSCFLLPMQTQFPLTVRFPHPCFFSFSLPHYNFYSITRLTPATPWPTPSLPLSHPLPSLSPLSEPGVQAAPEWQGDIVCHISIPRQSPFSPESNYFFQSERFNLL